MSDLDTLVPQATEVVIGGETVRLSPLKVGQLPGFLRAISPVMQQISSADIDWLSLFGERGDDLLSAIAIAVGKPRVWVDELAADEAILLAAKVIEVNADFFTRTVMPRLDGVLAAGVKVPSANPANAANAAATIGMTGGSTPSRT
jgi:hypothetical protein